MRRGTRPAVDLVMLHCSKEKSREAWGWNALDHLAQDVKLAVRALSRNPAFTLIVVLTLAFGIGVEHCHFSAQ